MKPVTITQEEYDQLLANSEWLSALEVAGLDNWEGCDYAREVLSEWQDEK